MKSRKVIIAIIFVCFFILIGISIGTVLNISDEELKDQSLKTLQDSEGRDNHHAVGQSLSNLSSEVVLNSDESLDDIISNNEVTVINFFASWCDPCKRETPELIEYAESNAGTDIQIVGINIDDSDENRDEFLDSYEVSYPVFEFTDEKAITDEYKISLMPTTFFVDSSGEIVRAYIGEISPELITNYVNYVKER